MDYGKIALFGLGLSAPLLRKRFPGAGECAKTVFKSFCYATAAVKSGCVPIQEIRNYDFFLSRLLSNDGLKDFLYTLKKIKSPLNKGFKLFKNSLK